MDELKSEVLTGAGMRLRIAELEEQLRKSQTSETKAVELAAHNAAAAQSALLFNSAVSEVAIGRDDKGELLYKYKIDLPPSGGLDIKINGMPYYHGETYTFAIDLLRTIKEIVQRTWGHEQSIQGSNENFYRKQLNRSIGGR